MLQVEMVHGDRSLWAKHDGGQWRQVSHPGVETPVHCSSELMGMLALEFYQAGLDRAAVYLEDTILVVPVAEPGTYRRLVITFDVLTGMVHRAVLDPEQLGALFLLSIGGDDVEEVKRDECYKLLEVPLLNWPNECRPVP